MEQGIFSDALNFGVIDEVVLKELKLLYQLRNRAIHRYIISNIKTRDLFDVAMRYSAATETVRLILSKLENKQMESPYGVYGEKFGKSPITDKEAIQRVYASTNDKHLLGRFKRKIATGSA